MSRKRGKPQPVLTKRAAARYAAIQALYQAEISDSPMTSVIAEFKNHRLHALLSTLEEPRPASPAVDFEWFEIVVSGTWSARENLDAALVSCLSPGWSLDRCGYLLRACLRCGAFELAERHDVPVGVVISEYVDLAHLYFSADETAFVNAVLDRAAKPLRSPEPAD